MEGMCDSATMENGTTFCDGDSREKIINESNVVTGSSRDELDISRKKLLNSNFHFCRLIQSMKMRRMS